jgi:hypothetical protein
VAAEESLWRQGCLVVGLGPVRKLHETLNGKKKACARDGFDVRRCPLGIRAGGGGGVVAVVAVDTGQEREQGYERFWCPLRIRAGGKSLQVRLKSESIPRD